MKYWMTDPRSPIHGGILWQKGPKGIEIKGKLNRDTPFELVIPTNIWVDILSNVPRSGLAGDEYRWKPNKHTLMVIRREGSEARPRIFFGLGSNGTGMNVELPIKVWADIIDFMDLEEREVPMGRFQLLADSR